jgi:hypothetical protein
MNHIPICPFHYRPQALEVLKVVWASPAYPDRLPVLVHSRAAGFMEVRRVQRTHGPGQCVLSVHCTFPDRASSPALPVLACVFVLRWLHQCVLFVSSRR